MSQQPPEIDEDWGEDSEERSEVTEPTKAPKEAGLELSEEDETKLDLMKDLSVQDVENIIAYHQRNTENRKKLRLIAHLSREELEAVIGVYRKNNVEATLN